MSEWTTPKIDWTADDRFNIGDYNRIKNNLDYLYEKSQEIYGEYVIADMGEDLNSYTGYWDVDTFNKFESNLETINQHMIDAEIGYKQTFYANGVFIGYAELNRIENALLTLKAVVDGWYEGMRVLSFRLGGGLQHRNTRVFVTGIVATAPTKTAYQAGETLDLSGCTVSALYSDGSSAIVTNSCTFSPANGTVLTTEGETVINISYTKDGRTYTASTSVVVEAETLLSIAVTSPTKTEYLQNESLDLTGCVVTAHYRFKNDQDVTSSCVFTPANGATLTDLGDQNVSVSYTEYGITKTANIEINVAVDRVLHFEVGHRVAHKYYVGDQLYKNAYIATIIYASDPSTTITIPYTDLDFEMSSEDTFNSVGLATINATYTTSYGETVAGSTTDYVATYWSTGTDAEITQMLTDAYTLNSGADLSWYWSIGETRTVHLNAISADAFNYGAQDAQDIELEIVGFGVRELTVPIGEPPFNYTQAWVVVGMKNCLSNKMAINPSYYSSRSYKWAGTPLANWCNNQFRNAFPAYLSTQFKSFKLQGTNESAYFALYSEKEVTGSVTNAYNETDETSPTALTVTTRKKIGNYYTDYWLRSRTTTSTTNNRYFCYIDSNGNSTGGNNESSTARGIAVYGVL